MFLLRFYDAFKVLNYDPDVTGNLKLRLDQIFAHWATQSFNFAFQGAQISISLKKAALSQ